MAGVLLFILQISGFSAVILCSPQYHYQYHFVKESKNWTEAQTHCREAYTDMATIRNMDDMTTVKNIIENERNSIWIGLYKRFLDQWRWSLEDKSFYGPGEYEFRNWFHNQPTLGVDEECVRAFEDDGKWHDAPCTEKHIFFCYDGRANASEKHKLISQDMSWHSAQTYCREHFTDLASVTSLEQNQNFQNTAKNKSFWTGLFRDTWIWSDGTNISFQFWVSSELSNAVDAKEYCAFISPDNDRKWGDAKCERKYPFLCYKKVEEVNRKTIKLQLKSNSLVNMEDPEVQAAILQQIQRKLQQRGLPSDTKISWKKQTDGKVFHEKKKSKKKNRDEL